MEQTSQKQETVLEKKLSGDGQMLFEALGFEALGKDGAIQELNTQINDMQTALNDHKGKHWIFRMIGEKLFPSREFLFNFLREKSEEAKQDLEIIENQQ